MKKKKQGLTKKQKIFCHEYIIDYNGTRAAKVAGYSEKTAFTIASENLKKPYIKDYIKEIDVDIAKEAHVSKLRLINELTNIATGDIVSVSEKIKNNGLESLTENERKIIVEIYQSKEGDWKVKGHDKIKAIQDILRAMGWNEPDKVDVSGKVKTTIKWGNVEMEV